MLLQGEARMSGQGWDIVIPALWDLVSSPKNDWYDEGIECESSWPEIEDKLENWTLRGLLPTTGNLRCDCSIMDNPYCDHHWNQPADLYQETRGQDKGSMEGS